MPLSGPQVSPTVTKKKKKFHSGLVGCLFLVPKLPLSSPVQQWLPTRLRGYKSASVRLGVGSVRQ